MKWIALALALFSSLAIADIHRSYIKDATVATLVKDDGWNVVVFDIEISKHNASFSYGRATVRRLTWR